MKKELITAQLSNTLGAWHRRVRKWETDRAVTERKIKSVANELKNVGDEILRLLEETDAETNN